MQFIGIESPRALGGSPGRLELIGHSPAMDSAAAECLWLKQHEPYHFQRAASLLTIQDFIAYWHRRACDGTRQRHRIAARNGQQPQHLARTRGFEKAQRKVFGRIRVSGRQ